MIPTDLPDVTNLGEICFVSEKDICRKAGVMDIGVGVSKQVVKNRENSIEEAFRVWNGSVGE